MVDANWPKATSPTLRRVTDQAREHYGIDLDYEKYLAWCDMISHHAEGDNYFKVHSLFSKWNGGPFFALYIDGQWVAVRRAKGAKHIGDVLEPAVLNEFRDTTLHYHRPEGREVLRRVKQTAQERLNWEHLLMSHWIEASERIRKFPKLPGVRKLGDRDGQEVWAVNRRGLYWIACLWDPKSKYITEILDREPLYQAGILERQADQDE